MKSDAIGGTNLAFSVSCTLRDTDMSVTALNKLACHGDYISAGPEMIVMF